MHCRSGRAVDLFFGLQGESPGNGTFPLDSAGDSGIYWSKKCEHGSPETFEDKESPHLAGLSRQEKEIL